jgi:hypothetical protein
MAKADYTAADRRIESLTAGEKVNETVFVNPDAENKEEAYAAGVLDNSFIDYDVALGNLEDREDIESFDAYTRRSYGVTGASFAAGEHMRPSIRYFRNLSIRGLKRRKEVLETGPPFLSPKNWLTSQVN